MQNMFNGKITIQICNTYSYELQYWGRAVTSHKQDLVKYCYLLIYKTLNSDYL